MTHVQTKLLEIRNISKRYHVKRGYFGKSRHSITAVDDVSFSIAEGETLSLVGESGCGKSTLGQVIVRLTVADSGAVYLEGEDITHLSERAMREKRDRIQIVFQDPFSTFSPRMTIGQSLADALWRKAKGGRRQIDLQVSQLLADVGLNGDYARRYPHELSGGQCQRVAIARALASDPRMLICDESVSALDVSVQAQIINLLQDIQDKRNLAILFISHDLSVVRHISNRVAVMYLGRLVELASRDELFAAPLHPYSRGLMAAARNIGQIQNSLDGEAGDAADLPPGCRFHPRCPLATARCRVEQPDWRPAGERRWIACHNVQSDGQA